MHEIKINKRWTSLKTKKLAKLLGVKKKKVKKCFSDVLDYMARAIRVARPFMYKGKEGALAWDRFEDEHFIFFVNKKTGKRKVLFSTTDAKEAKAKWKKLLQNQAPAQSSPDKKSSAVKKPASTAAKTGKAAKRQEEKSKSVTGNP